MMGMQLGQIEDFAPAAVKGLWSGEMLSLFFVLHRVLADKLCWELINILFEAGSVSRLSLVAALNC